MNERSTFIIAEVGQAHDGSLGILHSYIDAVSKTGANAIKFQTHIADAESSKFEPFRKKFSYVDNTRFDYWKRMEFTKSQWNEIKSHTEEVGLDFISTPFSIAAVELLEAIDIKKYKIGSGDVNNLLMIKKIIDTKKEIILSSGMSDFDELDKTVKFIKNYKNKLSILQCTSKYPTKFDNIGLNVINELKKRYKVPIGFSDHSGNKFSSIAAATLGAEIIEAHIVFSNEMFGPDTSSSIELEEFTNLVKGIRFIDRVLNNPLNKGKNNDDAEIKKIFGKSLSVRKNLEKNHVLCFDDLESKKPYGYGINASEYQKVIGKKLKRPLAKNDFLTIDDLV